MAELTIGELLNLPLIQAAEPTVYVGSDQLDRTVRWVHSGEISDIASFIVGGEMLLTAGLGIGHTDAEQRDYIRRLATSKAAVLVVELVGRAFSTMPPAVVDECQKLNFPLIGIGKEIRFVEVSSLVHQILMGKQFEELATAESISETFMTLLRNGAGHLTLAAELSSRVRRSVVIEDMTRRVLGYTGASAQGDETLVNWEVHSRLLHETPTIADRADPSRTVKPESMIGCVRHPIILRGEHFGYVHVLPSDAIHTRSDSHAIERATTAIAISLLGERAVGAESGQRRSALINRLLLGDISPEGFVSRALALGVDLRGKQYIVVEAEQGDDDGGFEEELNRRGLPAIVATQGENQIAIVGADSATGGYAPIRDALKGKWAGLSRMVRLDELQVAVRQARIAGSVASAGKVRSSQAFDELGVHRLLASLAEGPELARYVEDELGTILRHDARSGIPLLPTLREYLRFDGNKSHAAEALFIQRRTIYYRLERVQKLIPGSLDDASVRQGLHLAVSGLDLLRKELRL